MKKFSALPWCLPALLSILTSCGAHSPSVLKPEYKSIHVAVFKNESLQYGIEERLTPVMRNTFMRDGRLKVVSADNADLEMEGVIADVAVYPLAYSDLDRAVGYNMRIQVRVSVMDVATEEFLMKDRPFEANGTFMLYNEPTQERTEDVAVALAENVLSNLIEGW